MKISLLEGKRDEALGMFLPLFQKRGIEINISQLKQFLLNKFVTEANIHALSQGSNFYLLGVARYYFNGELTKNSRLNALYPNFKDKFIPEVCERLDALVGILRGIYIDSVGTKFEQPEDFGNLTLEALFKKYNKVINKALGLDVKEVTPVEKKVDQSTKVNKKYTYDILYSFDDAKKYNQYTTPGAWCITYGKQHYDAYVKKLGIHYVIFKQNGFENVPRRKGKNWTKQKPQDEYGNSLIAVLQSNKNGEPIYITSRWNHGVSSEGTACEADHAYTKEEFFNITGCNDEVLQRAFEQWKIGTKERGGTNTADRKELYAQKLDVLRTFKYAQMMINGGANIQDYIKGGRTIREAKNFKGTYLVWIEKDDTRYYTIMDRKKMFYDQYLIASNYGSLIDKSEEKFVLLHDDNRKSYYIFDLIHHQFVTLDGCCKFRTISSDMTWGRSESKYTAVAQSGNQVGLINLETMKVIKAPNGGCWFESITNIVNGRDSNRNYSGKIDLPYDFSRIGILKMVYDSAARESYLYDVYKGGFIPIIGSEDGFHLAKRQNHANTGFLKYVKGDEYYSDKCLVKYQRTSNNDWFRINGCDTFKSIEWNEDLMIGYKCYNEETTHYMDGKNGNILEINGKPVETWNPQIMHSGKWVAISLSKENDKSFWDKCLLFNPISRTFYHDDISGYYFHIYGGGKAFNPQDNSIYHLPTPEAAAQQIEQEKRGVKNDFNNMMQRMDRV